MFTLRTVFIRTSTPLPRSTPSTITLCAKPRLRNWWSRCAPRLVLDGNVWFTGSGDIATINLTSDVINEYAVPYNNATPACIVAGPDW